MKIYATEREGQEAFFKNFGINPESALIENTDGVWNGNLLEFKKTISDTGKVLFQCVKYLSKLRISGRSVPQNIVMIDLNRRIAYVYDAQDFYEEIHIVYCGSASLNNDGFNAKGIAPKKIDYADSLGADELKQILRSDEYVKIRIDENCIVGWAERYYRENPKASKGSFIGDDGEYSCEGEIRRPVVFKRFIVPYEGETNEKFKYLMDKLNDRLKKKKLGAFYTPEAYAEKAHELLQMAIARVPEGNDYVIIDRCAGTGNLEAVFTDEELSHCILSTYEYFEYKVLFERLGDKVRHIVPPTEQNIDYVDGLIVNADAMSKEFVENPVIRRYVDDPKVTVIMYENPPYSDANADNVSALNKKRDRQEKNNYVYEIMKAQTSLHAERDVANRFIWSAFNFYMKKAFDSYIVFSPIKYWKSVGLCDRKFISGFIFNRKYFHATASAISCIAWGNEQDKLSEIDVPVFDVENEKALFVKNIKIKQCKSTFKEFVSNIKKESDIQTHIFSKTDGYETTESKYKTHSLVGKDIIGYLVTQSFTMTANDTFLLRLSINTNKNTCQYLRSDNYLTKLPLFCAKMFPQDKWYEKDVYFTTADGGDRYTRDNGFLKSCLIYTCLSRYNKCLSFNGSDGRFYRNELCFHKDALANVDLKKFKLDADEKELLEVWGRVLDKAEKTGKMVDSFTYGPYQIEQEINTFVKAEDGKNVYDYPELNSELNTLKVLLKKYYTTHIREKMFEYELVK
uniref:N-6 DNA Methylase n=1 Tax=Siphoviridae sp. ctnpt50 TaxID=2827941 RepID=A0A8S5SDC8_9CAUD|nr:MAG TPA: N-6 DNA Methylase [Siphoviridae sp. ctnpt50]